MTIKQIQCLLAYFGYYDGAVDGVWGRLSIEGTEKFQNAVGLQADGICGPGTQTKLREMIGNGEELPNIGTGKKPATGTFWDEIEFFTREEFRCQCGGKYCNGFPVEPQEETVRIIDEIRRRAGVPISIVDAGGSGVRCPVHNANVGGVANSKHLDGGAGDLHPHGKTPAQLYAIAEEVTAERIPGRGGIGLYSWGIHVDNGKYSRWNG